MLTKKHSKRILSFMLAVLMFVNGTGMVFADNTLKSKLKLIEQTSSSDFTSKENVKLYEVATAEELLAVFRAYNNGTLDHDTLFPKTKNDVSLNAESDNTDSADQDTEAGSASLDDTKPSENSDEVSAAQTDEKETEESVAVAADKDLLSVISAKSFNIPLLSAITPKEEDKDESTAAPAPPAAEEKPAAEEAPAGETSTTDDKTETPAPSSDDKETPEAPAAEDTKKEDDKPATDTSGSTGADTSSPAKDDEEDKKDDDEDNSSDDIIYIRLTADIDLKTLTEWEAIGTSENPFTGILDGNGKTISGITVGKEPFEYLINYGEKATIKNITIVPATIKSLNDFAPDSSNLYATLYNNGVDMTVVNCTVAPQNMARAFSLPMLLGGVAPDITWYPSTPPGAGSTFTVNSAAQVAGIAVLVNDGTQSFDGMTIKLAANIDLAPLGTSFQPIGTKDYPFKGTITTAATGTWARSTLSNLTISQFGNDNVGFIGYGESARIENINFLNSAVYGTSYTGTAAGSLTGNSAVINCAVSGTVNGAMYTGGLVGRLSGNFLNSYIANSYSTASVSGSTSSGGIVGIIESQGFVEDCFSTGDVSASSIAGGIAGTIKNTNGVQRCASSGTVRASGLAGGIGGTGNSTKVILNSYTSSQVYASSDSGAILGGVGYVEKSYTSGNITSANPADGYIRLDVGYSGSSSGTYGRRDAVVGSSGKSTQGAVFFATSVTTISNDFLDSSMTFAGGLPVSGTYPQIKNFNNPTITPPEFQIFSEITTNVDLVVAKELYYGTGGNASETAGGAAYVLPTLPSGSTWKIRYDGVVGNDAEFSDSTLATGINSIELESSGSNWTLKMDAPLVTQEVIKLVASTNVEGLEIFYEIILKDQAVRVEIDSIPVYFHTEIADMGTNNNTINKYVNTFTITFPEQITLPSGVTATLEKYTGFDAGTNSFTGTPTTVASYGGSPALALTVQNDSTLKINWPATAIEQGSYYVLTVAGAKDKAGNTLDAQVYYLRTLPNTAPKISFIPTAFGVVSTNATKDEQVVAFLLDDENFEGVGQDILVEDEDIIVITGSHVITFTSTNPSATKGNFHQMIGEHILEYQVTDSGSLTSNIIKRTYRISSDLEVSVQMGSTPRTVVDLYSVYCDLTNDDIITIAEDISGSGLSLQAALQNAIMAKINLQATLTDYNSVTQNYNFQLNLETVTMNNLIDDANFSALTFDLIDPSTNLPIQSGIPILVSGGTGLKKIFETTLAQSSIMLDKNTFVSTAAIQTTIDPKVEYTKGGTPQVFTNYTPVWTGTINPTSLSTQTLTFQATNIMGLGFDLPAKKIPVTLFAGSITVTTPTIPSTDKEATTDTSDTFWLEIREKIEAAKPGETVIANVKYKNSYAPVTVFMALEKKDDVTLQMNFDKDVKISIHSSDVDLSSCETSRWAYNVNVVPMENVYITRFMATNGYLQQFYTLGKELSYGTVTLSMPLDKGLADLRAANKLSLYRFDTNTHEYELISKISEDDIKNNVVSIRVSKLLGEYVIGDIKPVEVEEVIKPNPGTGR